MTQFLAKIPRSFLKSVFCVLLAFGCLFGFAGNAFALGGIEGKWVLTRGFTPTAQLFKTNNITIDFHNADFSTKVGKNEYNGDYKKLNEEVAAENLITGELKAEIDSSQPGIDKETQAYLDGLKVVNTYRITANQPDLLLLKGSSNTFVFGRS